MNDEGQKVCDICHKRRATHHTCYGETGETKDLCMICFEQSASPVELDAYRHSMEVIRNGKCKYCGAPAVSGCTGLSIPGVIEQQAELWCEACRMDLVEFARRPENAMPKNFNAGDEYRLEQIAEQLAERTRRQEEFMRERIKERSK